MIDGVYYDGKGNLIGIEEVEADGFITPKQYITTNETDTEIQEQEVGD